MTNQALEPFGVSLVERRTAENVNTLMFRAHASARQVAAATGLASATLSRKLRVGGWTLSDLVVLSRFFSVNLEELTGEVPSLATWERRRRTTNKGADGDPSTPSLLPHLDSNQEPSGYALSQVRPTLAAVIPLARTRKVDGKSTRRTRVVDTSPTGATGQ